MARVAAHILAWVAAAALGAAAVAGAAEAPTTRPAAGGKDPPADNLEYWLGQAPPAASQPAKDPAEAGTNPFAKKDLFRREDALPGVVEFSDGTVLPGGLYTTRDTPWSLWVEQEKRWRQIPFINVLAITSVVVEEEMVQEWRWQGMGIPERVYTGREYPTRRFLYELHLIDGTKITGAIKGQPLWVEVGEKSFGPLVLHERSKGEMGQKLKDLVYPKRIIVSRRMMDKVVEHLKANLPASQPAGAGPAAGPS